RTRLDRLPGGRDLFHSALRRSLGPLALPSMGGVVRAIVRNALSAVGNSQSSGASELGTGRRSRYQHRDYPLYAGDPCARCPLAREWCGLDRTCLHSTRIVSIIFANVGRIFSKSGVGATKTKYRSEPSRLGNATIQSCSPFPLLPEGLLHSTLRPAPPPAVPWVF